MYRPDPKTSTGLLKPLLLRNTMSRQWERLKKWALAQMGGYLYILWQG